MYSGKLLNLFDKNKKNYKNYHKKIIFFLNIYIKLMINTKMTSKNISINIKDNFNGTALTYACLHNSIEIVELLLKNECVLNIGRTIKGNKSINNCM